ncbi:MAG: RNA-binding S4 domain-containing protein [Lachnospiraceae bacterium]|nr:RNA-binding S4 domain-containing protein [Lachnospiraceae bacterium]
MKTVKLREEYIKLGQAMKAAGLVDCGVEAKIAIQSGQVSVNGETDERRGRKLYAGDTFTFRGETVSICK